MKPEIRKQVEDKLNELLVLCVDNHIPLFATVAEEKNGSTEYIHCVHTPTAADVTLSDDKITKFNAALGSEFYIKIRVPEQEVSAADLIGDFLDD